MYQNDHIYNMCHVKCEMQAQKCWKWAELAENPKYIRDTQTMEIDSPRSSADLVQQSGKWWTGDHSFVFFQGTATQPSLPDVIIRQQKEQR